MSVLESCNIAENTMLQKGLYSITMEAPKISEASCCGQFLHIACGNGTLLRRPISICTWQSGLIRIVFQVKGEGTKWLSERKTGDVLDVLGPLGNGFDLKSLGERPVFVGGGIGVPPMLACAQKAKAEGASPTAVLGFRDKDAVILEEEFKEICGTFVTTDDGSYSIKGFVTDVLKGKLNGATGVAACGPRLMLKGVAGLAEDAGVPCQVSLEERMGCGIGACLVCVCGLRDNNGGTRYGHVCKDGPVFDSKEVEW